MRSQPIALYLCFVVILAGLPALASAGAPEVPVDLKTFTLGHEGKEYSLRSDNGVNVPVPADWLEPPKEAKREADSFVPSFNYDRQVTAFPIGDGRIGLHLSSYEIQTGGSAQAAAGRDVFLLFDPKTAALRHGGMKLGITKDRLRVDGRVSATAHTFFIGDINGDRILDLGVVKEEITWKKRLTGTQDEQALVNPAGPSYSRHPIRWYVLAADRWSHQPQYDGKFPQEEYQRLPLIGLVKSPVDFVDEAIYPGIRKSSGQDISRPY